MAKETRKPKTGPKEKGVPHAVKRDAWRAYHDEADKAGDSARKKAVKSGKGMDAAYKAENAARVKTLKKHKAKAKKAGHPETFRK